MPAVLNRLSIKKIVSLIYHKLHTYTKQQKVFVVYLFVLTLSIILIPIIKINPIEPGVPSRFVFLLSGSLGKTALIIFVSLLILVLRNTSSRFKIFVGMHFGFTENEHLFNFGFLWLITTMYISISDTIGIFTQTTTIQVTRVGYSFVLFLLFIGLVLTLISLIKKVQHNTKNKIINIIESPEQRMQKAHKTVQSLFGENHSS